MKRTANARFAITSWDEKPYSEGHDLPRLTRATVTKTFTGDIEGYREGDGVHSGLKFEEGIRHEFSTVSTRLKDDLVIALGRFGLVPSRHGARCRGNSRAAHPSLR